ncbi:hypothetical protein SAMD00019534_014090 [Acytostelium subglobosum LB1]|uniref:hypothetical protein n=1 Tax=Acytostelium subglobosum LB1 TaxID=1410327 RepID=UPI000644F4AE|nr:hypothetical protein SAMD00019534_014090 [Acytostelium subglobosum LB1]GAM18234.1 hypothetical protein SAMD00019534_014090 [Acytostelium subglobosum LB1]|eukprot:XP_012758830.1 hypothetical protein SAMD00019534_014090 [Acytostelium subglobosum LB1]
MMTTSSWYQSTTMSSRHIPMSDSTDILPTSSGGTGGGGGLDDSQQSIQQQQQQQLDINMDCLNIVEMTEELKKKLDQLKAGLESNNMLVILDAITNVRSMTMLGGLNNSSNGMSSSNSNSNTNGNSNGNGVGNGGGNNGLSHSKKISLEIIDTIVQTGLISRLVALLSLDSPALLFEVIWTLTSITRASVDYATIVVNSGAIPPLIRIMVNSEDDVMEQSLFALGTIAESSPMFRDALLHQTEVLSLLVGLLTQQPTKRLGVLRCVMWTLSTLCGGKPYPSFERLRPLLPLLYNILASAKDQQILGEALMCLSYMTRGNNQEISIVATSFDFVPRILDCMNVSTDKCILTPAIRTFGNIVAGDHNVTMLAMSYNPLPTIYRLLQNNDASIRKEMSWIVSNIVVGGPELIQRVVDANIMPIIVNSLQYDDYAIKKECLWIISNLIEYGNEDQIRYLVELGCIQSIGQMMCQDLELVVLATFNNIITRCPVDSKRYIEMIKECGALVYFENRVKSDEGQLSISSKEVLMNFFNATIFASSRDTDS